MSVGSVLALLGIGARALALKRAKEGVKSGVTRRARSTRELARREEVREFEQKLKTSSASRGSIRNLHPGKRETQQRKKFHRTDEQRRIRRSKRIKEEAVTYGKNN